MDDDTKRALDAMMAAMNDGLERVLNRIGELEAEMRNLKTEHDVTRKWLMSLPGPSTLMNALEAGFIDHMTRLESRLKRRGSISG